jgi:Transglycosylase SLT domain
MPINRLGGLSETLRSATQQDAPNLTSGSEYTDSPIPPSVGYSGRSDAAVETPYIIARNLSNLGRNKSAGKGIDQIVENFRRNQGASVVSQGIDATQRAMNAGDFDTARKTLYNSVQQATLSSPESLRFLVPLYQQLESNEKAFKQNQAVVGYFFKQAQQPNAPVALKNLAGQLSQDIQSGNFNWLQPNTVIDLVKSVSPQALHTPETGGINQVNPLTGRAESAQPLEFFNAPNQLSNEASREAESRGYSKADLTNILNIGKGDPNKLAIIDQTLQSIGRAPISDIFRSGVQRHYGEQLLTNPSAVNQLGSGVTPESIIKGVQGGSQGSVSLSRQQSNVPTQVPTQNGKQGTPDKRQAYVNNLVDSIAEQNGIHPEVAKLAKLSILPQETSHYDPMAVSSAGAEGIMQLMPDTGKKHGVRDPFDIRDNIRGGLLELQDLYKKYNGDISKTLAGYNAGPGAVDKHGGVPPYKETQNYVEKGTAAFNQSPSSSVQSTASQSTLQSPSSVTGDIYSQMKENRAASERNLRKEEGLGKTEGAPTSDFFVDRNGRKVIGKRADDPNVTPVTPKQVDYSDKIQSVLEKLNEFESQVDKTARNTGWKGAINQAKYQFNKLSKNDPDWQPLAQKYADFEATYQEALKIQHPDSKEVERAREGLIGAGTSYESTKAAIKNFRISIENDLRSKVSEDKRIPYTHPKQTDVFNDPLPESVKQAIRSKIQVVR